MLALKPLPHAPPPPPTSHTHSGRLMKLVVTEIRDTGAFKSYPQPAGDWVTYKNAPQEVCGRPCMPAFLILILWRDQVLDVVDQKLRDLTYKHYAD